MSMSFIDELGSQDINQAYDWTSHIGWHTAIIPKGWEQYKQQNPADQEVVINSLPTALNTEQRKLYDLIISQYSNKLSGTSTSPLLLNMDGVAGSGKTFIVLKTYAQIQELAIQAKQGNPIF
jgi:primosomal protein N'